MRGLALAVLAALLLTPVSSEARGRPVSLGKIELVRHDSTVVFARPSDASRHLAVLVEQTQVRVLSTSAGWSHVSIWASVRGWVHARDLVSRKLAESVSSYTAPPLKYPLRPAGPFPISAAATAGAVLSLHQTPSSRSVAYVTAGSRVHVTAWRQDRVGRIWYRVRNLWTRGDDVRFVQSDPAYARGAGAPIWRPVRGKGMWLTLGTAGASSSQAIVAAARSNGISHLYVESAVSPLGFHGRTSVGPLLHAAHRYGIAVIAWVYPYLYDIASDVTLTRQVATFRTSTGDRFDGLAADLERNFQLWRVRSYSQLVRRYVGPHYLLVGVTYPPQGFPGYPFAEIGRSYNVIAPMDYWHQTKTARGLDYGHMPYGYEYGRRFAADSVLSIHRAGAHVPIAPIGQVFDNFGKLEMGPHAPSASEINGFLAGSKASGSIGASFFQWMTATDAEWRSIKAYRF